MKQKDPSEVLAAFVARYPTQQAAAEALDIVPSHLTDLLRNRRTFSDAMLGKLGLKRAVIEDRHPAKAS